MTLSAMSLASEQLVSVSSKYPRWKAANAPITNQITTMMPMSRPTGDLLDVGSTAGWTPARSRPGGLDHAPVASLVPPTQGWVDLGCPHDDPRGGVRGRSRPAPRLHLGPRVLPL